MDELRAVFGATPPPPWFSNRLLRVLHGRRVDGTLDLPPPEDIQSLLRKYPSAVGNALHWLRKEYPIDEDAAIVARIEREEASQELENPAELIQRADNLGLYGHKATRPKSALPPAEPKYVGPQSGHYKARLSEKAGDVFGQSELDRIRAENIASAEKEEEELQSQINQLMAEVQNHQSRELAQRPDHGIEAAQEIRPPNEFEKWVLKAKNRAQTKLTLDSPEVAQMTFGQRVLPSLVFTVLVCAGCYLFAQYWTPPKRSERMFPDVSLSFATVGALIAMNVAIYCAWMFPPLFRVLNRYFLATPAYPRPFSMLGNIFSHQSAKHLLPNMIGLLVFGLGLHEDVGRGTFLAIYISSGVLGSLASLSHFALNRMLITSSLGSSGSVWGVMTAYCWLHRT